MRRTLALALATTATACALFAGIALAQNAGAITQRRAYLKEMGDASAPVGRMVRGETPFDLAPVQAFLDIVARNAERLPAQFPPDSRTGGETRALPAIWERHSEFTGLFARLRERAVAARAAITNEATFRPNITQVLGVCGECHRPFRAAN